MTRVKLEPRLVPAPLWGWSAAQLLKGARWQRIRSDALAAAGGACVVCGVTRDKGMTGDEEWSYRNSTATLTGVRILCRDCSAVTHIGNTSTRGYLDVARDHMARVNGISPTEADKLIDASFAEWRTRSRQTWRVGVSSDLLERYPELAVLVGRTVGPGEGRTYP